MNFIKLLSLIFFVLLIAFASCNNNKALQTESQPAEVDSFEILRPSLLIYGLPGVKDRQRQIVDDWYKFRFRIIAGCVVTDSLVQAAKEHNRKTDSTLTVRMGKNWQEKFEYSVDSLYSIDSLAIEIAMADKFILNFDTTTEKYNDEYKFYPNLRYTSHPTTDENIRIVLVEGYGVSYGQVGWVSYLRAKVDMIKKKVVSIDTTQYSTL